MVICALNLSSTDAPKTYCNIGTMLAMAGALYLVLEFLGNRNLIACFFAALFLLVGKDIIYVQKYTAMIHPVDLMVLCGTLLLPFLWLVLSLVAGVLRRKSST